MNNSSALRLLRSQIFNEGHPFLYLNDTVMQGDGQPHDHDFLEIALVGGGSATHISARGVQPIQRGDLFVLRPGAWHSFQHNRNLHVYNCCCAPEFLRRELSIIGGSPAVTRLLWTEPLSFGMRGVTHHQLTEDFTLIVEAQMQAMMQSANEPFIMQAGRLLILLGQLGQKFYPENSYGLEGVHAAVQQAVQLFEDGYSQKWNLPRLARLTRLSASYLTRLFKASTGLTPMAYLARHRIERAAKLLIATDLPISEIAAHVGWVDPNYFARQFRVVFGMTPSDYREKGAISNQ